MARLINTALSEVIILDNSSTWQHYQDNPFPFHMDHPDKITFWPVTSKLMDGFKPNFTCMSFSSGDSIYIADFVIHE